MDITVVLIIKLIIIYALWFAFFSHPLDDHLTGQIVGDILLGTPLPPSNPTP